MAKIKMKFQHRLGQKEALRRMQGFLSSKQALSPEKILNLKEDWEDNIGKFSFLANEEQGQFKFSGLTTVTESEVDLILDVPMEVKVFSGDEIKEKISAEAESLLTTLSGADDSEMDPDLRQTYMEAYEQQMKFHPGYFPKELLAFARKENLDIPPQVKK